jgi:hypothetical protein
VPLSGVVPRHGGVVGYPLVLPAEPDEARHHAINALAAEKLSKLARAVELMLVGALGVSLDG